MGRYPYAYYLTCQKPEKPDGPAKLVGPFETIEEAKFDFFNATVCNNCQNKHVVGRGEPSDDTEVVDGMSLTAYQNSPSPFEQRRVEAFWNWYYSEANK
jgi:hypothetical protein